MKAKLLLLLSALLISLSANAQIFANGTKWKLRVHYNYDPQKIGYYYQKIEGSCTFDGKLCQYLFASSDDQNYNLIGLIHEDGQKVYYWAQNFGTNKDKEYWYLLYDFGLKMGDRCVVQNPLNEPGVFISVDCLAVNEDGSIEVNAIGQNDRPRVWIPGVGTDQGVIMNMPLYNIYGNNWYELLECTVNGRTIYPAPAEDSLQTVKALGNEAIYNLSGQKLPHPQPGINIINGKKIRF